MSVLSLEHDLAWFSWETDRKLETNDTWSMTSYGGFKNYLLENNLTRGTREVDAYKILF